MQAKLELCPHTWYGQATKVAVRLLVPDAFNEGRRMRVFLLTHSVAAKGGSDTVLALSGKTWFAGDPDVIG